MTQLGRVIGTERRPNTAYTFWFWSTIDAPVGIGTLVRVDAGDITVYGTVTETEGFNDLESPLHEFLAVGGRLDGVPPTERPEMRVYQAAVLRREPEEPVGAVPIGPVFLAEEADVRHALRTDSYADGKGVAAGCYGPRSSPVAVHFHRDFLLGPESGHLNMTGTSGLAAKTSYLVFLIQSLMASAGEERVAAVVFNTKGGDLLYLDHDPLPDTLKEDDLRYYAACGLTPGKFSDVRYYAPPDPNGIDLNTLRRNAEAEEGNPTRTFRFGLSEIIKHADVLLTQDDLDAKADGYLQYLNDEFVSEQAKGKQVGDAWVAPVKTLGELVQIVTKHLNEAERNGTGFDGHHVHTIRKMRNRLDNFAGRYKGLISDDGMAEGPFQETFESGVVYVIDVANLGTQEQDLVFAAAVTHLREKMESRKLGVDKLVVVVDELNKYTPSGGRDTYVARSLKEIASRGRYLGLVLFGAQQFRSRVDKEVVGNSATHAFGHVEAEELAQPGYGYFTPAVKEKLATLPTGEVLVKHPHFAQPIFLRFPRPAYLRGSDGMAKFPQTTATSERDAVEMEFRKRRQWTPEVQQWLAGQSPSPENMLDILRQIRRSAEPVSLTSLRSKRPAPEARPPRESVAEPDPFAD